MRMKSFESVRLLVILEDVLGSILKGVVCHCLLLAYIYIYKYTFIIEQANVNNLKINQFVISGSRGFIPMSYFLLLKDSHTSGQANALKTPSILNTSFAVFSQCI